MGLVLGHRYTFYFVATAKIIPPGTSARTRVPCLHYWSTPRGRQAFSPPSPAAPQVPTVYGYHLSVLILRGLVDRDRLWHHPYCLNNFEVWMPGQCVYPKLLADTEL
jgi:hypothetical protein